MTSRDHDYLIDLVRELSTLLNETDCVEFKVNNAKPQTIGQYISALANAAALHDKEHAHLIWGIEDKTHAVVGTDFSPATTKMGNEPLETWLLQRLNPRIDFRFYEVTVDGQRIVLLEVAPASHQPVAFDGDEFIRVGSTRRRLKDYPEKERALWRIFDKVNFEDRVAAERVRAEEVLLKLNSPAYFDLLNVPFPDGRSAVLDALQNDRLIVPCQAGGWNITNLGAILFAKNLGDFPRLKRKAIRVIQYNGVGRTKALREQEVTEGYVAGFKGIIDYIMALVPTNEVIEQALRRTVRMFPEPAVRELVANALIHQEFFVTGAGPMVEIFDNRIEITNPGEPLVDTDRFVDTPPKSRNEALASLMRRFHICEERGSGIDKVVEQVEIFQLPAPLFQVPDGFTRTILFAHKALSDMDKVDRVRACYLHACLRYVMQQPVNNTSIRERFGISKENSAQASRLLKEALESEYIVIRDPEVGSRSRTYLPYWAS